MPFAHNNFPSKMGPFSLFQYVQAGLILMSLQPGLFLHNLWCYNTYSKLLGNNVDFVTST